MISHVEIEEEANKCDEGKGGPVLRLRDSLKPFMRANSYCIFPKGKGRPHAR